MTAVSAKFPDLETLNQEIQQSGVLPAIQFAGTPYDGYSAHMFSNQRFNMVTDYNSLAEGDLAYDGIQFGRVSSLTMDVDDVGAIEVTYRTEHSQEVGEAPVPRVITYHVKSGVADPLDERVRHKDKLISDGVVFLKNVDQTAPFAPGGLESSAVTTTTATISWEPVNNAVDYEVFQDDVSIGLTGGEPTIDVAGLTAATQYTFHVVSVSENGVKSTESVDLVVNTAAA